MQDGLSAGQEWFSNKSNINTFRNELTVWGKQNFRPFPWRLTEDPYRILIAEVMLHRTRVLQVVPVYERFISQYPELTRFVQADLNDLKIILHPLGLHWRIDLIYRMGHVLREQFGTRIPEKKTELLSLPGVSEYIASAVRCFAWNLSEPLMDTNTVRIAGRVLGWEIKDSSRRSKRFRKALSSLINTVEPRYYNYGLLDLAHLVCLKKQNPLCTQCPVMAVCCFGQSTGINN